MEHWSMYRIYRSARNQYWQLHQYACIRLLLSKNIISEPCAATKPVCAQVQIDIHQDRALARRTCDSMLRIINGLGIMSLKDVHVDIRSEDADRSGVVTSSEGNDERSEVHFFISVDELSGIRAGDGAGSIAPGETAEINWVIIPTPGAAEQPPLCKGYSGGAILSHSVVGKTKPVSVEPDAIMVTSLRISPSNF